MGNGKVYGTRRDSIRAKIRKTRFVSYKLIEVATRNAPEFHELHRRHRNPKIFSEIKMKRVFNSISAHFGSVLIAVGQLLSRTPIVSRVGREIG